MADPIRRRDLDTPFKDANGQEHPGWHRAEVVLRDKLWDSSLEGVPPEAAEELRRTFADGGMTGIISSPQGALDASPGFSGRVWTMHHLVACEFKADWGGLHEFSGPRLREALGQDADAIGRALEDIFDWVHDPAEGVVFGTMTVSYGTHAVHRFATSDFDGGMDLVTQAAAEFLERDRSRRDAFTVRLEAAIEAAQAAAPRADASFL